MDGRKGGDKYGYAGDDKQGGNENEDNNEGKRDMGHIFEDTRKQFVDGNEVQLSNTELPAPDEDQGSDPVHHSFAGLGRSFGSLMKTSADDKSASETSQTESETTENHDVKEDDSLGSDINICISDTKLQDLKQKLTLKQKLEKLFGVQRNMSQKEFDSKIKILYKCCLKSVRDLHELHLRRVMGLEIINDVIMRAKSITVSMTNVIHITWSIMSCIHHFQLRLRTVSIGLISFSRRKKAEECMNLYSQLIRLFRPEMHRIILNAVITFYREGKLWEIEFACTDLIVQLLQIYQDAEEGIEDILYTLETSTLLNVHEAKCLTQILYEILKKVRWKRMSEYLMKKILYMLESSIVPRPSDNYNYLPLRKGLEICMKNTIGNLGTKDLMKLLYFILKNLHDNDLNEETIMCFGNLATYGAKKFRINSQESSIFDGPLLHIFRLYQINNNVMVLHATRMWQSLIDRNNNAMNFLTPRIFLRDCNYGLTMPKCHEKDKAFFKTVRHLVYEITLNTFTNYLVSRMAVENMYQAVALTLIEIPCGYTASCFITVAMSLQEFAFNITQEKLVESHHLHATVLSLLTLICYIHNATVFYDYVNTIMERRAEWAPHLNPPLKAHYEYAQHHVLWNKPELFFEDWEARYGLWKCFRTKKKNIGYKSFVV